MHHTTRHIQKIPPSRRLEAARRLTEGAASGDTDAAARFLRVADAHKIGLECLWASSDAPDAPLGQTVLIVPSPGSTGMVFTSQPGSDADVQELASVIDAACASLSGAKLIQTLMETRETRAVKAFQLAGFQHVGDLLYMRRDWRKPRHSSQNDWPEGVTVRAWRDGDDPDLALALERSYIDTLDCPALCGMRTTEDVIESHRSTGEFTPDLWWIVRRNNQPAGVLLLNP